MAASTILHQKAPRVVPTSSVLMQPPLHRVDGRVHVRTPPACCAALSIVATTGRAQIGGAFATRGSAKVRCLLIRPVHQNRLFSFQKHHVWSRHYQCVDSSLRFTALMAASTSEPHRRVVQQCPLSLLRTCKDWRSHRHSGGGYFRFPAFSRSQQKGIRAVHIS